MNLSSRTRSPMRDYIQQIIDIHGSVSSRRRNVRQACSCGARSPMGDHVEQIIDVYGSVATGGSHVSHALALIGNAIAIGVKAESTGDIAGVGKAVAVAIM